MIELQQVTKIYRGRTGPRLVLDGVDLQVRRGEKLGILGGNGAGKSTLVRLLSGAEPPTRGQVRHAMRISWPLAFGGGFQGGLTGLDNARFVARIHGADPHRVAAQVEEFAELGRQMREPVKHYSSGMRARLAFALSMAIEFDCYLIDEIVAVGDRRFHERCHEELFVKRSDRAMVIVSHDPHYIRAHCARVAVLQQGRLTCFDDVEQGYRHYEQALHGTT